MEFRLQAATKQKIRRRKKKTNKREKQKGKETNTFKTNVFQQIYVKNDLFG